MYPVLYRDGAVVLYTHDVFTALGLLVGLLLYYWELRRRGMLEFRIFVISVMAIFRGGIGARIITAWEHLPYYSNQAGTPPTYLISHSGKSIIDGIVGGYIVIVLAKRTCKIKREAHHNDPSPQDHIQCPFWGEHRCTTTTP